jgi:hypothetical protein
VCETGEPGALPPSPNSHASDAGPDQLSSAAAENASAWPAGPEGKEKGLKRGPTPSKPAVEAPLESVHAVSALPSPSAATSSRDTTPVVGAPRSSSLHAAPERWAPRAAEPSGTPRDTWL